MYGIIDINKEAGVSSHKCVNDIRKILDIKRVGHSGTLDVEVSGVLNIYVGRDATKFIDIIKSDSKKYIAEMEFFKSSDTYDIWGDIESAPIVNIEKSDFENAINSFVGKIEQVPPMYSALKYKGKPLYKYARMGIDIKRKAREISIYDINILDFSKKSAKIEVVCSKGTYIRSLIHDIGVSLGTEAIMTSLIRTVNDYVALDKTYKISEISEMAEKGNYSFIRDIDKYLDFDAVQLDESNYNKYKNGFLKSINRKYSGDKIVIKYDKKFVGIALWNEDRYMVKRII